MADEEPTNWWRTLPGLFTALAAVITAITGLVVGLGQVGLFDRSPSDSSEETDGSSFVPPPDPASSSTTRTSGVSALTYEATLPLNQRLRSGDTAYEILGYETRPDSDHNLALSLSVRMTNHASYGANFWDDSFRVIVGGDIFAASGGLNELVAGEATRTGTVLFVLPDTTRTAQLKIRYQATAEERTIPFELRPQTP
jgi:hypothetical protein